ncbi:MAG: lasso peptide biosynthesis B2 protein [Pyrinomonadaceae bacterium]
MGAQQLLLRAVRFARRRPRELLLLARMAGWVLALSVLIKLLPLPRAIGLVATTPRPAGQRQALPAARLAQLIDLLLGLNLLVFTPTCWKRAPVLQRYLALYGMETRIIFGVRKTGSDTLAGHAWLESDGQPVFEPKPPEYIVTYAYP